MTSKLIKIRLMSALGQLSGAGGKSKPRGRVIAMLLLYIFLAAFFAAIFSLLAVGIAQPLIAMGADWFYFLLFIGITVTVVFVFGIFETKSDIFECKDNELLLSMPIKPISIVLSRVLSVVVWNYIESALIFVPAIVVYGIRGGLARGIVGASVLMLFIPLLPTALSCLVGFLVSLIASKFKKKTLISVVFFLAFFAAYMFGYSALMDGVDSLLLNVGTAAGSVGRFAILRAVGNAALLKPLPLVLIALAALLSVALTVAVISVSFEKIAFASRGERKTEYRAKRMKGSSVVFALTKKELHRFFTSSTYIINSSLGIIFMLFLAVYAAIKSDELFPIAEMFGANFSVDPGELCSIVLVALLMATSSFTYISSCSLSLEGKSLWIMKSMPLAAKDVLLSKALAHLMITSAPTFISSVILLVGTADWPLFWYYILAPQAMGVIAALVGVLWNTVFPKLEFTNEAMVIKNSVSVFLTMLTMMLLSAVLVVGGVWLLMRLPFIAILLLELLAFLLVIAILVFLLVKFATVKYESL